MTQPTPRVDAREFIERVVASGLMDRDEVLRALETMPPTERGKVVARHLVETGKLTKFQARHLLVGRVDGFILGQYRVLEELGRGGMGHVYKAVHQTMGRFVALKVLAPDLTKTERARNLFQREVRAAAKLHHPNIVTAFDANPPSESRCFLVMEYVDGPNLSQLVKEQGPLPIEQACEYIRQAAIGLEYAHHMGLIHRDVKPSNLLVQQTTSGPQVKILDFGLALVTAGEAAGAAVVGAANTVLGTPDYVSPEQSRDQYNVDGRSDLYSLGCAFYFLLTGEPPFVGGTNLDKLVRHGSEPPVAVQLKRPDVPEPVAAIVHKLLAKNPKWRYQTAGELATELAAVVVKKADWRAPPRTRPKPRPAQEPKLELELELDEADASKGSSGIDPLDDLDLEEPSASTIPTAAATTGETPSPHRRPPARKKKKELWPFIVIAILLAFAVVAGVGVLARYLIPHFAP